MNNNKINKQEALGALSRSHDYNVILIKVPLRFGGQCRRILADNTIHLYVYTEL